MRPGPRPGEDRQGLRWTAVTGSRVISSEPAPRYPTTGTFVRCCARAASGHAIALPSPATNSRRFIRSIRQRAPGSMAAR